jgi:hypothetical protein
MFVIRGHGFGCILLIVSADEHHECINNHNFQSDPRNGEQKTWEGGDGS